jgi:hypothetical protein
MWFSIQCLVVYFGIVSACTWCTIWLGTSSTPKSAKCAKWYLAHLAKCAMFHLGHLAKWYNCIYNQPIWLANWRSS